MSYKGPYNLGGSASLTPEAGKIPLANSEGKIDAGWLPEETTALTIASFTWDSATASPKASTTSTLPAIVENYLYNQIKGCVLNADGTVNYYLQATDWAFKEDGTASDLSGADGNVMVEIPRYYYRVTRTGTLRKWEISIVPMPGFTIHPAFIKDGVEVSKRYIGAYDACMWDDSASAYVSGTNLDDMTANIDLVNDKLASVSGVYPLVGVIRDECRKLAENNGAGWRQLDYTLWSAIQILYLVEHQSFYSQAILGAGNTNGSYLDSSALQTNSPHTVAGAGNSIANGSTDTISGAGVSAKPGVSFMKYRGIENFYGNCWNWTDGININVGTLGTVYITNDSTYIADNTSTGMDLVSSDYPTASAYVTDLLPIEAHFLAANASGGSSSTYITDYQYKSTSTNRVVRVGGGAGSGADAGAFCLAAADSSGGAYRTIGARLAY